MQCKKGPRESFESHAHMLPHIVNSCSTPSKHDIKWRFIKRKTLWVMPNCKFMFYMIETWHKMHVLKAIGDFTEVLQQSLKGLNNVNWKLIEFWIVIQEESRKAFHMCNGICTRYCKSSHRSNKCALSLKYCWFLDKALNLKLSSWKSETHCEWRIWFENCFGNQKKQNRNIHSFLVLYHEHLKYSLFSNESISLEIVELEFEIKRGRKHIRDRVWNIHSFLV